MQFNKTFLVVCVLIVAVAVTGVGYAIRSGAISLDGSNAASEADNEEMNKAHQSLNKRMGGKETPIEVSAEPAFQGTLTQRVSTQGRVYTYEQTDITNEIAGILTEMNVRDGDFVEEGDVIARIDDREHKLSYEDAKSKYMVAKADLVSQDVTLDQLERNSLGPNEEIEALDQQYELGEIDRTDYERQRFNLELKQIRSGELREQVLSAKFVDTALVNMEKAALTLEKCAVVAPFDGYIFEVAVSEGTRLAGGTKICRLVGTSDLVLKAQVLESEVGAVQVGRPATMRFTALEDLGWVKGEVVAVSPTVNEEEKTVETIVRIDNPDKRIRPGMYAEVKIDARDYEDRLLVPKLAIITRDNRRLLFKVGDDSRAKWIYVKTGVENEEYIEVLDGGLQPGEMVLTDNHFTMGHDTLVKIKN